MSIETQTASTVVRRGRKENALSTKPPNENEKYPILKVIEITLDLVSPLLSPFEGKIGRAHV